jgi:hypothetical protein
MGWRFWRPRKTHNVAPAAGFEGVESGEGGPGPRSRHCLVYDQGARACVLFSGHSWEKDTPYSDTWQLQHCQWSRVEGRPSPPGRHRAAMVYDTRRGQAVLFGGQGKRGNGWPLFGDTWIYADRHWRQCDARSGTPPAPRCGHSLAFDEETGFVVLFGGVDARAQSLGDTWLFDGSTWQPVLGSAPPPRRYAAFAFDLDLDGCVLHGGSDDESGLRGFGDTWLFRDRTWKRLASAFDTTNRDDHSLAYDRAAKRLVMLGGLGGTHGVFVREQDGWRPVEAGPLPPRFQCSPLAWNVALDGLVFHGGEACHGGPQFQATLVLHLSTTGSPINGTFETLNT